MCLNLYLVCLIYQVLKNTYFKELNYVQYLNVAPMEKARSIVPMEYNLNEKGIMVPMEYTLMVYSPN